MVEPISIIAIGVTGILAYSLIANQGQQQQNAGGGGGSFYYNYSPSSNTFTSTNYNFSDLFGKSGSDAGTTSPAQMQPSSGGDFSSPYAQLPNSTPYNTTGGQTSSSSYSSSGSPGAIYVQGTQAPSSTQNYLGGSTTTAFSLPNPGSAGSSISPAYNQHSLTPQMTTPIAPNTISKANSGIFGLGGFLGIF